MQLYRIYTQNVHHAETVKLIKSYFPGGFTLINGTGWTQNGSEHSLIIDIVTDSQQHVYDLAWDIMKNNHQEFVLVVANPSDIKFIQ